MRIFLLGAKDPEMDMIEEILKENNQRYSYAKINNKRTNPTESYKATNELSEYDEIIFIECSTTKKYKNTISIDHHRKGDMGYNLDYNNFLPASSIGQLLYFLIVNDIYKPETHQFYIKCDKQEFVYIEDNWYFRRNLADYYLIDKKYVITAAIDHSLKEAYEGLCKGVTREEVIKQRKVDISSLFEYDVNKVEKRMDYYKNIFKEKKEKIIDLTQLNNLGIGYSLDYLCLRELAIINNQAIVIKNKDVEDGPDKVMFLSISAEQAEDLLKLEGTEFNGRKVVNMFGVPNRGYVGGFLE